jgi:penicillin-binding protein 1A
MSDGTIDYQANPQPQRVVSDGVAWSVTQVLKADILGGGTSSRANIGRPAAGKTGSTENLQDAWFVGYTPDLSTSVWIGYPHEEIPMTNVHGTSVFGGGPPATIWKDFMTEALKDAPQRDFSPPAEMPKFKKLVGKYVLFGGGEAPAATTATTATVPGARAPSSTTPGSSTGPSSARGTGSSPGGTVVGPNAGRGTIR